MRLFAIVGGLVLSVLIAVLVVPYFINWSDYKGRFELAATELTGQQVRVDGAADVRLLPFPSLSFGQVIIGDRNDPIARVENFSVDVELAPFLTGELHIFDMRLDGATFVIDANTTQELQRSPGAMPDLTAIIKDITLEQATVSNGRVLMRGDDGSDAWRMTDLNGVLSADSRVGPFRFTGDGVINGVPVAGDFSTGRLRPDGFSLTTNTRWQNRGISVSTQGQIVRPDQLADAALPDVLHYDGAFQVAPLRDDSNRKEIPFLIEGVFVASDNQLSIDQYRASFGAGDDPYSVDGDFVLRSGDVPSYSLSARGTQLNWGEAAQDGTPADLNGLVDQLRAVFAQLPLPTVAGTVSVDLPAVIYGDTTVRDVRFEAVPAQHDSDGGAVWRVARLEAKLPGRTQLEAVGDILLPGYANSTDAVSFDGRVVLASRQPSGFAAWFGLDNALAVSQLRRAGLEGDLTLTMQEQRLDNLALVLDDDTLAGSLVRQVTGARPLLSIDLKADGIVDTTFDVLGEFLNAFEPKAAPGTDVDLALDFTEIEHKGIYADRLGALMRARPGELSVDRFQLDGLFGSSLAATAIIRDDDDAYATDFDITLVSADATAFVAGVGELAAYFDIENGVDGGGYAQMAQARARDAFDDVNLAVRGRLGHKGRDQKAQLTADVTGAFGGTRMNGSVRFDGAVNDWTKGQVGIDATLDNERASVFAAQLGLNLANDQPADMTVRAKGIPVDGLDASLAAHFAVFDVGFEGAVSAAPSINGTQWALNGALQASGANVDSVVASFALPVDLSALVAADAGAAFDYASAFDVTPAGVVSLSDTKVLIGDVSATGNVVVSQSDGAIDLSGSADFEQLDLTPVLAAFAGVADAGTAQANKATFGESRLMNYKTRLALRAGRLVLPALAEPVNDARFTLDQTMGELRITELAGAAFGGSVAVRLDAQNTDGVVLGDIQLQLTDADAARLPLAASQLKGRVNLNVGVNLNGATLEALRGSATGSGSLRLDDFAVSGLNSAGLPPLIAAADAVGFGITQSQIAGLAATSVLDGESIFEPVNGALSLANGVARLTATSVQSVDGQLSGLMSGSFDLSSGAQTVQLVARFMGDDGAAPGLTLLFDQSETSVDALSLETFLVQRSISREQQRIAALQARLNERQRLRRAVRQANFQRSARLEAERLEAERLEAERIEAARLEAERAAQAEIAAERERLRLIEQQKRQQQQPAPAEPEAPQIERQPLPPVSNQPSTGGAIFNNLEFSN